MTIADMMILLGLLLFLGGLALIDWRIGVAALGLALISFGALRLRGNST